MSPDDISKTVDAVMWAALALTALVLVLSWKRGSRDGRARIALALVIGAACWAYNLGLLIWGQQPFSRFAAVAGVTLGIASMVRLSLSTWPRVPGLQSDSARFIGLLAAW